MKMPFSGDEDEADMPEKNLSNLNSTEMIAELALKIQRDSGQILNPYTGKAVDLKFGKTCIPSHGFERAFSRISFWHGRGRCHWHAKLSVLSLRRDSGHSKVDQLELSAT